MEGPGKGGRILSAVPPPPPTLAALALTTSITLSGCTDPGPPWTGNDESLLGYALTFLMVAAIGVAAALVVLITFVSLLAASSTLIAWNLARPHPIGRTLGIGVAVLDTMAGAALFAGVVWLSIDTTNGHTRIDLDGGGFVGLFALILLLMGPATFLAAIAPRRASPPGLTTPATTADG